MADGNPQILPKRPKAEEVGGETQPKEEVTEEPPLPLVPPTVQEEIPMVFNAYAAAPAARRRREKGGGGGGGGDGGPTAGLYVDRRKSKVWNYYAKLGDAYVECNICKKQLSFHNSTTTMREHLVRKHAIRDTLLSHLKDDQGAESDSAGPENAGKRCRLTPENGFYHPPAACSEPRSEVITELVVEMIFRDLHPLSLVKDKGFGLLLGHLEPSFTLPSPAHLSGVLWHRYGAVKQQLERYLGTAQAVVLCVESWASQFHQSYWSVTANFIDGEWRRARCLMETQRAKAQGGLGEKLVALLAQFGLSGKSVFCVMHDGDAAEVTHGWSEVRCAARTLQLCVKAGLEVQEVEEALAVARGIVRYFQQDPKATRSLTSKLEAINKSQLKLVADVGARWLTTVEMCETLLELKWAIMAVLEEDPKGAAGVQNLADHQWKLLQDLLPIMRTLKLATAFLREEQNVSISSLLPCVHGVIAAIGQQAEDAGAVIKRVVAIMGMELRQRWGLAEEEKLLESLAVIASFLDPRFKEMRFLSPSSRNELHQRVKNMLSQVCGPQSPPAAQFWVPNPDSKAQVGNQAARCPAAGSQSVYDVLLGKDPTENMPEIHQQLENYVVEPLCKRSTDPLDWWKSNERRFPAVARLSRRFLAIPATVVLAERAFSTGQSVLEHRRALLAPENLDPILFLHQNYDFLEALRNSNERRSRNPHPEPFRGSAGV